MVMTVSIHMKVEKKLNLNVQNLQIKISQIEDVTRNHQNMVNVLNQQKEENH